MNTRWLRIALNYMLVAVLLTAPMQHVLAGAGGCEEQSVAAHAHHDADHGIAAQADADDEPALSASGADCAICLFAQAYMPPVPAPQAGERLSDPILHASSVPPARDLRPPRPLLG